MPKRCVACLATVVLLLATPVRSAAQSPIAREVAARVERVRSQGWIEIAGDTIRRSPALVAAYGLTAFAPLWGDRATQRELTDVLDALSADGLDPT